MGAYLIVDADKLQICVGSPVQRYVKIARKDLPLRSVVKFDKVALGMLGDLHATSQSFSFSR